MDKRSNILYSKPNFAAKFLNELLNKDIVFNLYLVYSAVRLGQSVIIATQFSSVSESSDHSYYSLGKKIL